MRVTADTNILVRAAALDDPVRLQPRHGDYRRSGADRGDLAALVRIRLGARQATIGRARSCSSDQESGRRLNGAVDRPAVEAGLALLEAGGDFADGVIAFEGRRLGGTVFASFDRRASELIAANGGEIHLLGDSMS